MEKGGLAAYKIYRALSYGVSPLIRLHLRWRRFRGLEHPQRWPERLGHPSHPRRPGPLVWFHAVSLGEGMIAIPVIKHCLQRMPHLNVLMTITTLSAFKVLSNRLPGEIILQFSPVDTPASIRSFLHYWKPNAIVLMESELWPNLIMDASKTGIPLVLLNARISEKSFKLWSGPVLLPLISLMLSKFSLIVPLSTEQGIRFQLLQAPPYIINFSGDLKYVIEDIGVNESGRQSIDNLRLQLSHKQVWMASSIHRGEEEIILGIHTVLMQLQPNILTIIVPRHPQQGREIAKKLEKEGHNVVLRSRHEKFMPETSIYVVDTLGELRHLYTLTPIAVVGGSLLPGLAGHNISEAAAAGCATLTGRHVGHFSHMVCEMQQSNPLSVLQVSGKLELEKALIELFTNANLLEARRRAAKEAFCELRHLYTLTPIAVVGGSLLPGLAGHNISEAAAAGCATLTGRHVGHFSHMVREMQQSNPLSVLQVSGKLELEKALIELFTNANLLEARRRAAKEAFCRLSSNIVMNIYSLLNFHIFSRLSAEMKLHNITTKTV